MGKMNRSWGKKYRKYRRGEKRTPEHELPGIHVLGPLLDAFVVWVLRNALDSGKKRLYFLARDGYFMYLAAKLYVERFSLPVECRYLSCSRYSLRLPMFHLDMEEAMEYICRDSIDVNLGRILNRAGLTEQEQREVFEEIGVVGREHEPIPYVRLEKIKRQLKNSSIFTEALIRHSKEALPVVAGYLNQEGLIDTDSAVLVDSGWVGSMQKTLNSLLKYMGRNEELEGYYWGLYELPPGVDRKKYHCYYFSPEGQLREKVYFNNNLFEAIFSAPHGMTLGYGEKDGKYEPVYAPVSAERADQMKKIESVLLKSARKLADNRVSIEDVDYRKDRRVLKRLLKKFMGRPTLEEAGVFGRMHFCDDVLEYGHRMLAEEMSEKDLRANHVVNKILVMTGLRKSEIKESAWYEGSAVLCSRHPGYHIFQYRIYKYLLYVRQMYLWRKNHAGKKQTEKSDR